MAMSRQITNLFTFIGIAAIFTLAACWAILTKPSREMCLQQAAEREAGPIFGTLASAAGLDRYTYRVEDHIFYKKVQNKITGQTVAYAYLGNVYFK